MTARLSEADLVALESVDEPVRVTTIRDLVADLRAERAKSERVEQENERLRSTLNRRIEGDEAERAVAARLRAALGRAVDALDTIMYCVITKPSEAAVLGIDGVCRNALKQARAALTEPEGLRTANEITGATPEEGAAFDMGVVAGEKMGRAQERKRIVAWLRATGGQSSLNYASAIEQGAGIPVVEEA